MTKPTAQELATLFEPLADVDPKELEFLIEKSRYYSLPNDEFFFQAGDGTDEMHLMLKGKVKVFVSQNNQTRELSVFEKGTITGLLPYSRMKVNRASGVVIEEAFFLSFHRDNFPEMIRNHYELTEALVHQMSTRIREFTTLQQQNEKMMALGKLSAGLAHELNNPASAIVRSSKELLSHLKQNPEHFKKVMEIKVTPQEVEEVSNILFNRINQESVKLSLMEKQGLEDDLAECLEERNAQNAYEIAENLVEFNFSCEEVERIYNVTGKDHFPAVIGWINENLTTEKMVMDIESASSRIADLVSSVKNFTHMDRSPDKMAADIHDGINNTLTMLNHKLKKNSITVSRNYDESSPKPQIMVSEMNQVWTNIIDNAIDALEFIENAELEISTKEDKGFIRILIRDNGPGIPEDVLNSIWDPFFTTKDVGKGTGLGLDVVKTIISRHNGSIKVLKSEPGHTEFEVCIPIE